MEELGPVGVEFVINNAEVRQQAEQARNSISGVAQSSESAAARVAAQATAAVQNSARSQQQAISTQAVTWRSFIAERMSEYMRMEGSHAAAMIRLSEEWAAFKAQQEAAVAASRATSTAAATVTQYAQQINNAANTSQQAQQRVLSSVRNTTAVASSGFNGLQNSINQLSRELPAFTYSVQTGFMAISNNLPILFDEIRRVAAVNRELTASGQTSIPVWKQVIGSLFSFGTILSVGITLLTVYGKEIGQWVKALFSGKSALDALKKSKENLLEVDKSYQKSMAGELSKLQLLIQTANNEKLSRDQRTDAVRRLNKLMPEHLGNITLETIKTNESTRAIEQYIAVLKRKSYEEAISSKRQDLMKQRIDLQEGYSDAKRKRDQSAVDVKNQRFKIPGDNEETATEALYKRRQKQFQEFVDKDKSLIKQIDDLDKQLQKYLEREDTSTVSNKKTSYYFQQIIDDNQRLLNGLDKSASDFEKKSKIYKSKILEARKNLKAFAVDDPEKQNKRDAAAYDTIIDSRKSVLEKIADVDAEYARKSFASDEEEVQALRDKFTKLRDIIKDENVKIVKYNQTHKAKISLIDASVLTPIEAKAESDLKATQAVEKEKVNIEKLKQVYEQYEQYKIEYGKDKADERFKDELKGYTDYVSYIKSRIDALQGKDDAGSNSLKDFFTKELPAAEQMAADKSFDTNMKNLKRILEATKTAKNEEKRINEQYDKDLSLLRMVYVGDELEEREMALAESRKKDLEGVKELAFKSSEVGKALAFDLFNSTREEIEKQVEIIRQLLKTSDLTPEQRKALINFLNNLKQSNAEAEQFYKLAAKISDAAGQISTALSELGDSIGGGTGYTISQLGSLVGIAGNAAGAAASFMTGDIIGGATKALGVVTGLFGMGKKVKAMNAAARAEVKKFYDDALKGERDYQALLRQRELDTAKRGKTSYQSIVAQLEALKKQSPELKKAYDEVFKSLQGQEFVDGMGYKHGTWLRKAKTWDIMASLGGADYDRMFQLFKEGRLKDQALADFQYLKELREELEKAGIDVEDLQKQLNEMLTGTSVEGLSDALADLFENGKLAAQDFGDTFENIVGKAILNTFKYSVIEKAMEPLYDQLTAMTEGGKIPSPDAVAAFVNSATAVGEGLGEQWKVIQDAMEKAGINVFDSNTSAVATGIQSIRADQASALEGILRGSFDYTKKIYQTGMEGLALMRQQYEVQIKIERNTALGAERLLALDKLDKLDAVISKLTDIAKNTSSTSLRGAGLG